MNMLNPTIVAPLVRGLFLDATGLPVLVAPDKGRGEAPAASLAGGQALGAGVAPDLALALTEACLAPDGNLDEVKTASCLKGAFATAGGSGLASALVPGGSPVSVTLNLSSGIGSEVLRLSVSVLPGALKPGTDPGQANSAACRSSVVAGKVALVTGGAQGFGAEIVRGLASSGAFVYIADLNLQGAASLAAELNALSPQPVACALALNVGDEASVAAMFDAVASTTGGLDLIVSNAGVLKASSVLDQDEKSFRFVTDVNYTGFFFMAKHGGRLLRRQWRAAPAWMTDIVQINSKSGLQGSNKNGAYAGSKFGSIGLVQSFALEFVEYGIKVNAICPGNFFDGPLWSDPDRGLFVQYLNSGKVPGAKTVADVKAFYEAKVPMGRGATGADVMRAVYYLVEQRYETGQALPVTGGQVMLN
jgi:sorbitol-6-phosphate 2-dehydrogenase